MSFIEAMPVILLHEGGYVNDPDDKGGATNKGITQKVYDSYRKSIGHEPRPVKQIQAEEVNEIYEKNYWRDARCDKLPLGFDLVHFDFAVNAGITQAAKTLQRVLGVTIDGKIGPLTLRAATNYGTETLIIKYSQARREFYEGLAKKPRQSKFLKSWLSRTNRCERLALIEVRRGNSNASC